MGSPFKRGKEKKMRQKNNSNKNKNTFRTTNI